MAESLDDGEFWLPPKFLADDEVELDDPFLGFGGFSDLSSPVESVVGSTETESDEEDFVAGLSRQMARSTVGDGLKSTDKGRSLSGSPQSTLCSVGGASRLSAPPPPTWDLLYAAAGEISRMKINTVVAPPPQNPSPATLPAKTQNTEALLYHQRLQAAQFQFLKQQQLLRLHQQSHRPVVALTRPVKGTGHFQPRPVKPRSNVDRPMGLSSSAWPSLPRHLPGTRPPPPPPFHGGGGAKRECAGTGVFLPRRKVGGFETKNKTACSVNLESQPQAQAQARFNGSFNAQNDVLIRGRRSNNNNNIVMNQEIRLPQEWTY